MLSPLITSKTHACLSSLAGGDIEIERALLSCPVLFRFNGESFEGCCIFEAGDVDEFVLVNISAVTLNLNCCGISELKGQMTHRF